MVNSSFQHGLTHVELWLALEKERESTREQRLGQEVG